MIKTMDAYVGRTALWGVAGVWIMLTLLMSMFTFLDRLGDGGDTLGAVLYYVALKIPGAAYVVFPVSALLGALIAVGGLAATNELVAFRTSGASRLRLSGSVLGAVFLLTVVVMAVGEWVMPPAESQARALKDGRIQAGNIVTGAAGIWIRDGNDYIHVGRSVLSPNGQIDHVELHYVDIYSFDEAHGLSSVSRVTKAEYDGTQWRLHGSRQISVSPEKVNRVVTELTDWKVGFGPDLLETAVTRPRYMSARGLMDQLDYLQENGLDSTAYDTVLWTKLLFPINVLALVLAGMPFLFGSARTHSLGLRVFVGMSLGGLFMIVSRTLQNFSDAYDFPPILGAAAPSLLLATAVIFILRRSV